MGYLRRLGVGLLSLLVLFSTALFVASLGTQTASAAPTYTYETIDTTARPNICGSGATGTVLAIAEVDQASGSGSSFTSYWCHVPQSTYEFAKQNSSGRIEVASTTPDQGNLRMPSPIPTVPITIGNSSLFTQHFNTPPAADENSSCESIGNWAWAACPLVSFMAGAIGWLDERIQALLEVGEDRYANPRLRAAWANFRNLAYIILIPIMLVMVIGTALGFEVFSAYTIKKALPRMVVAVIFITLSWYITTFLIGFFNVIGAGVLGLMTAPFGMESNMSLNTLFSASSDNAGDVASSIGSGFVQWVAVLGPLTGLALLAASKGGLAILLLYLMPAVLFVLGAFLVLVMREMFILAGVLLAPVAILAWVFPGNDGMWKLWWNTFSKLLIMFPLIMIIIGAGRIFAFLIDSSGGAGLESLLMPLLKLTAYILPYAFIPFAFKFAGGVFANLAGMVNNSEKGLFDRMKKNRGERWGGWNERRKGGAMFGKVGEDSFRGKLNTRTERLSNIGAAGFALDRKKRKARLDSALGTNNLHAAHKEMKENEALSVLLGNEDYGEAGRSGRGYVRNGQGQYVDVSGRATTDLSRRVRRDGSENAVRAYMSSRGYGEEDIQSVMHARASTSQDVFNLAAVLSIPGTGTGFGGGAGEMDAAINETVGNNRRLAATMLAEMRGTAERAGRSDLKGGGFGARREAMELQYHTEIAAEETFRSGGGEAAYVSALDNAQTATTNSVVEMTIKSTESRGIAGMKPKQIRDKVLPMVRAQLEAAYRDGNQAAIEQQLAKVASIYDQAQYSSPEVQEIIAQGLMSLEISPRIIEGEGGIMRRATVREDVESVRGNKTFLEHRREFGAGRSVTPAEFANMTDQQQQEYLRQQQEAQQNEGQ